MRCMKQVLLSIVLVILILNIFYAMNFTVHAAKSLNQMEQDVESFISAGKTGADSVSIGSITDEFIGLGQILTMIGTGVMIAITTYMGIKYITASPEGQAKLKQQLVGVIVSGIVIFGSYSIWKLIIGIVSNF